MLHEPVLVDTGALIALYNSRDPAHPSCSETASLLPVGKAYTCWPVVTEAFYLLRKYPRQRNSLSRAIQRGEFVILLLTSEDLPGIDEVLSKYQDQEVDLADAALVHLAGREQISTVFSTDRRHFSVYRFGDSKSFRILPETA
jgi:predicted nucleic acid-binding protein